MVSGLTAPFQDIVANRDENLRELASQGNRLIGYFCTYTPVELIYASGFIPVRIMGEADVIEKAYTLVPDFICPYLRKAVEKGLSGAYKCLTGIVQGYTCDVTCGLINIWEENIGGEVFHLLPLPYIDQQSSRSFLRSGLLELVRKLETAGGNFSEKRLAHALDLYAGIRTLMGELYTLRYNRRLHLSAGEFLTVVQAGFITPPERFYSMLLDLRKALPEGPSSHDGIPVLVSGSLIEDGKALEILEQSGGLIVADDLCTGLRNFDPPDGKGSDPIDRLMDRTMNRFPCPTRSSAEERLKKILRLMKLSGAQAVVFLFQKFCTPHLADHPFLNESLRTMNIPSIMVEMEEAGIMEGQMRTRFEGFFEMIRG
jgi:benzoyl-CoA reductase/2-hydroxyglutaryl-CoA dehydratase subunit BcrC/BadD/HgdB